MVALVHHTVRPPRLFVFTHVCAAVGIAAVGLIMQATGLSTRIVEDPKVFLGLLGALCAYEIGQAVGEWRGLRYARYVESRATLP